MDRAALTVPGSVLDGARYVTAAARDVVIREEALADVAQRIDVRLAAGIDDVDVAFGSAGNLERDVNLILFETACNFCFWSDRPEDAWKVPLHDGTAGDTAVGGWYGLAACFQRSIRGGMPVWDAAWMAGLTVERAQQLFAGIGAPIPLIEQRASNIVEVASFLLRNHHGQAIDLLATVDFSAPRIAAAIARELPSFRDGAWYAGRWVWILKRAQIFASDLAQLSARYPELRPMTSTRNARFNAAAVTLRRSIASNATSIAVVAPIVISEPHRSLSIVEATPITAAPRRCNSQAPVCEPFPPMTTRVEIRCASSCPSALVHPFSVLRSSQRVVPSIVPPR